MSMVTPKNAAKMSCHALTVAKIIILLIAVTQNSAKTAIYLDTLQIAKTVRLTADCPPYFHIDTSTERMKLLQLNVRCYATSKQLLEQYVDKHNIDIVLLSETWNKNNYVKFKDWNTANLFKNRKDQGYGGVAFLAKPGCKLVPRKDLDTNDIEICWGQFFHNGKVITIATVYVTPGDTDSLHKLFKNIETVIRTVKGPIIITGDLNARSYLWEHWHQRHTRRHDIAWKHGKIVEDYVIELGLQIHNQGLPTRDFTSQLSAPDLTLSYGFDGEITCMIHEDTPLNTDHLPIIIQLPHADKKEIKEVWDLNKVDWTEWKTTLINKLNEWEKTHQHSSTPSDILCMEFTDIVNSLANELIPTKKACAHSKPFMTPEIKALLVKCKESRKRYKKRRDPHNWNLLQKDLGEFIQKYAKGKQEWWDNKCQSLKASDKKSWRTIHKILGGGSSAPVQPLVRNDKQYDFDDAVIARRLEEVHVLRSHVDDSAFDKTWKEEVQKTVEGLKYDIDNDLPVNSDLTIDEIQQSIENLKSKDCPGPDRIHPRFIYECGNDIIKPLLFLFQACWHEGNVPRIWKKDNRIYIPKPGKDSYNTEKAYRSLSLNSCVGKMLEQIVTKRMIALLNDKQFFEHQQHAYIQGRDTNQALLEMTLDINKALKSQCNTGAILIDFEGAFDAVWRDGTIYKLHDMGITGRLNKYVKSFLSNRQSRSFVNSICTDWIDTKEGIPQGSVMGPILYILFTRDITSIININHVKFADDLSMWTSHKNASQIELKLNENMDSLLKWARQWRQRINIAKTETMLFTRGDDLSLQIYAEGRLLNQVKEKRILGVTIDSRLDFTAHIEQCAARGLSQVTKLGALTNGLNGASGELMLTLYKTCVRPTLEYCYPVWCSTKDITPLERVQYQALRKAVGALHGSPSSALHVITNILPLDLRLDEVLLNSYLKIVRKEDDNRLKSKIAALMSDNSFMDHKILTPLHKLSMILRKLSPLCKFENVEKQMYSSVSSCLATKATAIAYTPGSFGSSNNRCEAQAKEALQAAQNYLAKTGNGIVAFTDGSALGNPGPCGAGTAIFWKGMNSLPSLHKKPVSKLSSSYHGELQAIDLALQVICNKYPPIKKTDVHLITDCQSALQASIKCKITGNFGQILDRIEKAVTNLHKRDVRTIIYWTAGHINLPGNELADMSSKRSCHRSERNSYY